MKRYETFVIVDPDVSEDDRNLLLDRIKGVIDDQSGLMVLVDAWGNRRLAYDIKKKSRGYYVRLDFCGTGALVDELERQFRIDDRVMKYMTVLLSDQVDMEEIKAQIAKAEAEAEAAKAAASKTPPETEPPPEAETPEMETAEVESPEPEKTVEETVNTEGESMPNTEIETKTEESE